MSLNVAVIGGSLGGLLAGVALRKLGCTVHIYDKSPPSMSSRGAGIVVQQPLIDHFRSHGVAQRPEEYAVPSYVRQYLDREGSVVHQDRRTQWMTAWDILYAKLKQRFPDQLYHYNSKLTSLAVNAAEQQHSVQLTFQDGLTVDDVQLVLGADGPTSIVRSTYLPHVHRTYAGYVAWRGLVDEQHLPQPLRSLFMEKFTFYHGPATQALCYLVPGPDQTRRLNWVWYWNVSKEDGSLTDLLTDKDGRVHHYSLSPAAVRPEVWERQKQIACEQLPSSFSELICMTSAPFLQVITDLAVDKMAFDGCVCILGDAAFGPRPHVGASTAKAAADALQLASCIARHTAGDCSLSDALSQYEQEQVPYGQAMVKRGQELGNRSQFGKDQMVLGTAIIGI
eukprot:jgi/Chrzof1/7946/UNPLg00006.t1